VERINLADAKAHLSELVTRASQGEEIEIVRRGKTVARLLPPEPALEPFDFDALRQMTDAMSLQEEGAGDLVRRMRDGSPY